jgi:hypothetical protein
MLWFGKQAESAQGADDPTVIRPAKLGVVFDGTITGNKLQVLLDEVNEFEGGLETLLAALRTKQELMQKAFPATRTEDWGLSREAFLIVLSAVFPARRKLAAFFAELDASKAEELAETLVYGDGSVTERMREFCEIVPVERKKERRAIWDLAAEILHFRDPEGMPLMTRWVWDVETASGALREFIRGNDGMPEIPLDNRPETYEGARSWFAEALTEAGFYRDLPFLIDMLLAQAYADYVKAMSNGLGMVQAEFGGNQHPLEFVLKLLGVDAGGRKSVEGGDADRTLH